MKDGIQALTAKLIFNESSLLDENVGLLKKSLDYEIVQIVDKEKISEENVKKAEAAVPGSPTFRFWNIQ